MTVDLTIHEPSMTAGEAEVLVFALERSRAQFAWKTGGLDATALRRAFPPSAMTLGGLIKHVTLVEERYTGLFFLDEATRPEWTVDADSGPDWDWHTAADDPPSLLYARWHDAVARSRAAIAAALADGGPGRRSAFVTDEGESPNLRRALVDLHDEYARHVGHADLFREAVDGLVGEDPPRGFAG